MAVGVRVTWVAERIVTTARAGERQVHVQLRLFPPGTAIQGGVTARLLAQGRTVAELAPSPEGRRVTDGRDPVEFWWSGAGPEPEAVVVEGRQLCVDGHCEDLGFKVSLEPPAPFAKTPLAVP
jgi:hypothetical protein